MGPQVGNGWKYINYRYGTKGDGNGGDGGDRIETVDFWVGNGDAGDGHIKNPENVHYVGSMCYDYDTKKKNNTKQDAVIAVFCQ